MKKGIATLALFFATTLFASAGTTWSITGYSGGMSGAVVSNSGSWSAMSGRGSFPYGSVYDTNTQIGIAGGGGNGLPFTAGSGSGSWGTASLPDGNYVMWTRSNDVQTCNGVSYAACASASASNGIYFTVVTTVPPPPPPFFLTSASTTPLITSAMGEFGLKLLAILALVVSMGIAYLVFKFGWRKVKSTVR